jgi:hypothetical protein
MYKYVLNNSSANRLEKLLGDYVAHPDDKKSLRELPPFQNGNTQSYIVTISDS